MEKCMPLSLYPEGKTGRIHGINAGKKVSRRLLEMGFVPDALVQIQRGNCGSFVVIVNDIKYALGRGMAAKIMVSDLQVDEKCQT